MKRTTAVLVLCTFLAATLAGCIGGGFGSGSPRAIVSVSEVADKEHTFIFDARDSKGRGLSYEWDFGDGTTATSARVEHTYEYGNGVYSASLVIEDNQGTLDIWEEDIVVGTGENRAPIALFSVNKRQFSLNEPVRVDASASWDPEDDPLTYRWDFNHLMDLQEYEEFREAKDEAVEAAEEEDDGGFEVGASMQEGGPLSDRVSVWDPLGIFGNKHPPTDDPERIAPSLHTHTAETTDPVYVMEEGYPDATIFFIRLQVVDIKGGFEEIRSEEIWGVEVSNNPPETTFRKEWEGRFDFGLHQAVEELHDEYVPDLEQYKFKEEIDFWIPWPVVQSRLDGTRFIPGGFINLTWEANVTDELVGGQFHSRMDMNITTPNGMTIGAAAEEGFLQATLDGHNDYVGDRWDRDWKIEIVARDGIDIQWHIEVYAKLDTNPLSPWE